MKNQNNSETRSLTHIYVRDIHKGFLRPCWAAGGEIFCGLCMQGVVEKLIGSECSTCHSVVDRILEIDDRGIPAFANSGKERSDLPRVLESKKKAVGFRLKGSRQTLA